MKIKTVLFALAISFAVCKKNYTCNCTYNHKDQVMVGGQLQTSKTTYCGTGTVKGKKKDIEKGCISSRMTEITPTYTNSTIITCSVAD